MTGSYRIAFTLAAALLASTAQAQEKSAAEELRAHVAAVGTYAFSAREKDENGRTVCEETCRGQIRPVSQARSSE